MRTHVNHHTHLTLVGGSHIAETIRSSRLYLLWGPVIFPSDWCGRVPMAPVGGCRSRADNCLSMAVSWTDMSPILWEIPDNVWLSAATSNVAALSEGAEGLAALCVGCTDGVHTSPSPKGWSAHIGNVCG